MVTAATYLHFLMPSWATFALTVVCQRWKKHHFVWVGQKRVFHDFFYTFIIKGSIIFLNGG